MVDTVIESWLETFSSQHTVTAYSRDIQYLSKWMKGNQLTLNKLTLKHVQAFTKVIDQRTSRTKAGIKSFLKYCYDQGFTRPSIGNLGRCIRIPRRLQVLQERIMTKAQATRMIDLCSRNNTKLQLTLLLYTGCRISECRRLQRSDFKYVGERYHINIVGKGGKRRSIILGPRTSAAIREQLPADGWLFPGHNGKCISPFAAYRRVKRVAKHVLPAASPHWFRHTFCSIGLQAGCDIGTMSKQMGHASLTSTSSYIHSSDEGASIFVE
jgi:site-specific recombinase XerD